MAEKNTFPTNIHMGETDAKTATASLMYSEDRIDRNQVKCIETMTRPTLLAI